MTLGNFFDLGKLTRQKGTFISREEKIKREGSPYYTWEVPVTATMAQAVIDPSVTFPRSRKYAPLDWIEIANNDPACDLTVIINGGDSFPVPMGVIRTISGRAIWHLAITNNGGVNTTAAAIIVTLQKEPMTIDKWARRQA